MINPFEFGQVVTGKHFTNREIERKQLRQNFLNGIHTVIIAPRRFGKTSLVKEVANTMQAKGEIKFLMLDMNFILDEYTFYQKFIKQVLAATNSQFEEVKEVIKKVFTSIKPQLSVSTGEAEFALSLNFSKSDMDTGFEEILNFPEQLAKKKGIRLVIAFDEFQNIANFKKPELFQGQLRSVFQFHKHVSYCFFGSRRHMMDEIFQTKSNPFYQFGEIMSLGKIETKYFHAYITSRFKKLGKVISDNLVDKLIKLVDNYPQHVQHLAYKVFEWTEYEATIETILKAHLTIVNQYKDIFERDWNTLSKNQKMFLIGLNESNDSIFSQAFISTYQLGSSSNVSIIRQAMIDKDILELTDNKLSFLDPLFQTWISINSKPA